MKLYAIYNIESDVLMLTSVSPTPEMVGDEGVLLSIKSYEQKTGEWLAVMKNNNITILDRQEYYQLFGDQDMEFDKVAYFIKEE